jgi:hypothetical protein
VLSAGGDSFGGILSSQTLHTLAGTHKASRKATILAVLSLQSPRNTFEQQKTAMLCLPDIEAFTLIMLYDSCSMGFMCAGWTKSADHWEVDELISGQLEAELLQNIAECLIFRFDLHHGLDF